MGKEKEAKKMLYILELLFSTKLCCLECEFEYQLSLDLTFADVTAKHDALLMTFDAATNFLTRLRLMIVHG